MSEQTRARQPTILHVDMDAFFASVEQLIDPSIRNKPVIVGGDGSRGVVASCSYEARFFGIRSAMPSARAKRLCPQAIFVPGHYGLYEKYSQRMHEVFQEFTPLVEGISLDEAFLDVAGAVRLFGPPREMAHLIRNRLYERTGLRASVGAATTKHLAKLASQRAKPKTSRNGPVYDQETGVLIIEDDQAIDFLHALPVNAIWGVGPASSARLEKLGISTVKQLANISLDTLTIALGPAAAQRLHALAWNQDSREVVVHHEAKSIGHEQTFAADLHDVRELHQHFARLSDAVASRLREANVKGRTITAKVRFGTFETITRGRSLDEATSNGGTILRVVDEVTAQVDTQAGIRLLGISVSNLEAASETQLPFGSQTSAEALALDEVVDRIRHKFGSSSVAPAQLINKKDVRVLRRGDRQWGPSADDEK